MKKWCIYYLDGTQTWPMNIDEAITYRGNNHNNTIIGIY